MQHLDHQFLSLKPHHHYQHYYVELSDLTPLPNFYDHQSLFFFPSYLSFFHWLQLQLHWTIKNTLFSKNTEPSKHMLNGYTRIGDSLQTII